MLGWPAVTDLNPYRAPAPASDLDQAGRDATQACPQCGARSATKVGYTWWGGALGPRLFQVVKCQACGAQYNGKTGGKLTRVIIGYQVVVLIVCLVAFFLLRRYFLAR